ncbi:hypothetical protein [Polyangium mundeleinium]|uniref:Uncharacterized protein n=1 Tax=Polyangium mundeleinium TaxID=2995306 RepID=A0ABT5EM85_9BACT|nr:hypothetical protein [Polyangium mundeleinium]MDC0742939.1 hypothetical protein [Polyangium mundeleinium]
MVPEKVIQLDADIPRERLVEGVQQLSVAEIESMSIADISTLNNNVLKDVLNDAIRNRLAQHLGGTYTSAPKMSIAELNKQQSAG